MQKLTLFGILTFFVACAGANTQQQSKAGTPVFYSLDAATLSANKARVKANDPLIKPAYKQLMKEADDALTFGPVSVMEKKHNPPSGDKHDYMSLAPYHWPDPTKPDGLPYIRKDGQTNPEVKEYKDKEYLPKLCGNVNTLALAWFFSDDKVYAAHAAKLIRVWFLDTSTRMNPNLNFGQAVKGVNTGRGAGMIDVRHLVKVVDAIGLLQNSAYWTAADQAGMKKWFGDFLHWMQTSKIGMDEMNAGNNHGAWYEALRLALALYTGDKTLVQQSLDTAAARLDAQMEADGFFPRELARTTSLHYSTFVLEAFFNIASMSEKAGVNFWQLTTKNGKSLKKAFEAIYPYWTKSKPWTGQQIKEFDAEEAYSLLMDGAKQWKCKNCKQDVKQLAGEKFERLRLNLLF